MANNSQGLLSIARCLIDLFNLPMERDVLTNNKNLILWFEDYFETVEPFMEYITTAEFDENTPGFETSR